MALYRGTCRAKQSIMRHASSVRLSYLLTVLLFFVSTAAFAHFSSDFEPDHPEKTQCSIGVLADWESDYPRAGPFSEIEESESFELDDKDCVNRTPDLLHYGVISSRLSRFGQADWINRISEPHLRPPRQTSVSA